jgi:hypothetical protein
MPPMSNPIPPQKVIGLICELEPAYPPTVVLGQGGYPPLEFGPGIVPPGCAPGLPTLVFSGPWQH